MPPDDPIVVGGLLRPDAGVGGFEGGRGVAFLSLQVSCGGTRVELLSRGKQKHSTNCLFLQSFVESERDF